MSRRIDRDALMEFVRKRRKTTGGYGATPRLPATIQDTFQAVAISLVLGQPPPRLQTDPALLGYLTRMQAVPWLGIGSIFRLLLICRICGLSLDSGLVRTRIVACLGNDTSLAATYYGRRILAEMLDERSFAGAERAAVLPARFAVDDVARYLFVQKMEERPIEGAEQLTGWLQQAQNGDGGFGFFPGTTSFIENSHAALAALTLLGTRPQEPDKALAFILSCQTGGGGFARSHGAAPFLDASWHGAASLALLAGMGLPAGAAPDTLRLDRRLLLSL